jgi:hypothetical protein
MYNNSDWIIYDLIFVYVSTAIAVIIGFVALIFIFDANFDEYYVIVLDIETYRLIISVLSYRTCIHILYFLCNGIFNVNVLISKK